MQLSYKALFLTITCSVLSLTLSAQNQPATIEGAITNNLQEAIPFANVTIIGYNRGTSSEVNGYYRIQVPTDTTFTLRYTAVGHDTVFKEFNCKPGTRITQDISLTPGLTLGPTVIYGSRSPESSIELDPKVVDQIPGPSNSIERLLIFQGGVSSTNELSSAYNVRGGNYDENLIYVNDIEIYRPFLVRSGQQEGLSFINPYLVENVKFSAGGFSSKYGDRMSSVLDVSYIRPKDEISGSVEASLLGFAASIGDASKGGRFTQLHGIRYRTNKYVLGSLDEQGDYQPNFTDYQGFFTYGISEDWTAEALVTYAKNKYTFIPQRRETNFGTVGEAQQLTINFAGQEIDSYETGLGALSFVYDPDYKLKMKFIVSGFLSNEQETFDIRGAYDLAKVNNDLGSDEFGETTDNLGSGYFINHARNRFQTKVFSFNHKGNYYFDQFTLDWGAGIQYEDFTDIMNEWERQDSADYNIPYNQDGNLELYEVLRANNRLTNLRTTGYAQIRKDSKINKGLISWNVGGRFNYNTYNNQIVFSPRIIANFQPEKNKKLNYHAAWGIYHQPPFYKEFKNLEGNLNPEVMAQTAIHYVFGVDYIFPLWGRDFKFSGEGYYKQLKNLVPYDIDNVRIRYYGDNLSDGFATGVDFKLNGEFVNGVQSWINLSLMKTSEDLYNDSYMEYYDEDGKQVPSNDRFIADSAQFFPGYIPRPTDQRIMFSMFFQDYLPNNPTVTMNIGLIFGTGLPFGPANGEKYQQTLRMPAYRRVDLGMGKQLLRDIKDPKRKAKYKTGTWKEIDDIWLTLEVFNLLETRNTISYTWVKTTNGSEYGVPNYLTDRQINLKLRVSF